MNTATGERRIWRVLLVDDERLARKRLSALLAAHTDIEIVGEAGDVAAAARLVGELKPDVVFLDVQLMPGEGFDLLPHLATEIEVIFVTAHDAFAVRAFDANALDYLLKPVSPARLDASLERLRSRKGKVKRVEVSSGTRVEAGDPLLLRNGQTWHKLETGAVAAIRGEGSYTQLLASSGESILVLRSLQQWMEMLPDSLFVRLSRSLVVNVRQVERLDSHNRDRADLYLNGLRQPLQLGRVASRNLRRVLAEDG